MDVLKGEFKQIGLVYYADDNLMRAIWNNNNIIDHRDVDGKFFAVKFSQIVETLLLRIVI